QHFVYNRDGRKIPTLCLGDFIDSEITSTFEEKVHKKEIADNKLRCTPYTDQVTEEQKRKFLATLGVDRIRKKVDRFYDRLCELTFIEQNNIREPVVTYDLTPEFRNKKFTAEDFHSKTTWQQLLYESIFEALGYSQNKSIMQKLAQSVDVQYLSKTFIDQPIIQIEASLFNIGGLAPKITEFNKDKVSEYVRNISQSWETLSKIYDGQTFDETDWHFFRLRPHNFPTVRIAGGARLINEILNKKLIEVIITKIKEIKNYNVLINSIRSLFIVKAEGYWHNHYVFEDNTNMRIKYFVGAARADEIVINIIIPFFILYFDIFHQPENSRRVLKMYHIYIQKGENRIVHDVADSLNISDLLRRTIYTQGMLELFRNYCSKGKCMECEIGKVVFE
ncbi:MAG: DUF2851 family protein, partial [Melioribacteraceae bacterium]|nr:DUF2851 family protein [Melioribacteraceae bacterium]